MDEDQQVAGDAYDGGQDQQTNAYAVIQEEEARHIESQGQEQNRGISQQNTVSVSQLQQEEQRIGGPPLYEQQLRATKENNRQQYTGEEEEAVCGRFPHSDFCACDVDCQEAIRDISLFEVYQGIFIGPFQSAFKTGDLIETGVTHILNVTCKAYTKRERYFKYLDLHIYDEPQENVKKYFRITNRFINEALNSGGKVLIHSIEGKSRCATFILAYFISNGGIKLKDGLQMLRQYVGEVEPNEGFMQQLAQYDLELLQAND